MYSHNTIYNRNSGSKNQCILLSNISMVLKEHFNFSIE